MHVHEIKIHFFFPLMLSSIFEYKKVILKKHQYFTIFLIFCNFLPIWNPNNFFTFYWILLKLSMLIPLIAFYFLNFQCCYQLPIEKKLFKKICLLSRDITNKNSFFRTSNPNNLVTFQYFLLKLGMHFHEIKIHFLFSFILNLKK